MTRTTTRLTVIGIVVALGSLFAAQAIAVTGGRSARPAAKPKAAAKPVVIPADDPRVAPRTTPVPHPALRNPDPLHPKGDLIEISIPEQRLTAWRDGRVVMRVVISTGGPGYETPTGRYKVIYKNSNAWSSKWEVYMPWAMNWHGNYFIHQLPHYPGSSVNIGESDLGRPVSHGCVRVGLGDAERLYRWTKMYTPVWVH